MNISHHRESDLRTVLVVGPAGACVECVGTSSDE